MKSPVHIGKDWKVVYYEHLKIETDSIAKFYIYVCVIFFYKIVNFTTAVFIVKIFLTI